MSLEVPNRSDSQIKKIKKIVKSPEKYVVTGQTQSNIRGVNDMVFTTTSIENPVLTSRVANPNQKRRFNLDRYGLVYDGFSLNNAPHSEGALYSLDGRLVFKGNWANGARNGYGIYYYPDGSRYEGNWTSNQKDGKGIYYGSQGERYDGQWVQNRREGNGRLQLLDGTVLNGIWRNDSFVSGVVKYPNGSVYDGEFRNWSRNGKGSYNYPDSSQFVGQWTNNMKNGAGTMTFVNGDKFEGPFRQNLVHGVARYTWANQKYVMTSGTFDRGLCQVAQLTSLR